MKMPFLGYRYERFEQMSHGWGILQHLLRVPLHSQGEGVVTALNGFYDSIGCPGHGLESWGQIFDCLVVSAIDSNLPLAQNASQL